jgi:hypothetical protein
VRAACHDLGLAGWLLDDVPTDAETAATPEQPA